MLEKLEMTRTKAIAVAAAATVVVGGFAVAWASTGSPAGTDQLASSDVAGDISGNCDEAEHADDPECAGVVSRGLDQTSTAEVTTPSTMPTSAGGTGPSGGDAGSDARPSGTRSFAAADAGTVTYSVQGNTVTLVAATPVPGWRVEVERANGFELDLDFRSGTRRVQVDVEFEDGGVRERVRVRDDADDSRTETLDGDTTRSEAGDDRDDDRDDSSGRGRDRDDDHGGDDDDHGGDDDDHGGDDDDHDDSSGRSGSGHGSDD